MGIGESLCIPHFELFFLTSLLSFIHDIRFSRNSEALVSKYLGECLSMRTCIMSRLRNSSPFPPVCGIINMVNISPCTSSILKNCFLVTVSRVWIIVLWLFYPSSQARVERGISLIQHFTCQTVLPGI